MSDYVVESGASARARARRRRTMVTLGLVILLLFGAFWFAYSYWKEPARSSAAATSTCTTAARKAGPVKVNVYNATRHEGLAASTAKELKKRGYVIGTVANDPLHKTITGTAEVRYGRSGVKVALPIVALVAKPAKVVDARKDTSVDLVLGNGFKALTAVPANTPSGPQACTPAASTSTSTSRSASTTKAKAN